MSLDYFNGGIHGPKYGDLPWLLEQVDQLPVDLQSEIKERYKEIYRSLEGQDDQRFRSNQWIRRVVEKYKPVKSVENLPF